VLHADFDPLEGTLSVLFDRPLADFNSASGWEVSAGFLLAAWNAGESIVYTPGTAICFSALTPAGAAGPGPDVFRWTGDDGPLMFEDGSSLSSIPWTPVTLS
jgi:hypothetical protein